MKLTVTEALATLIETARTQQEFDEAVQAIVGQNNALVERMTTSEEQRAQMQRSTVFVFRDIASKLDEAALRSIGIEPESRSLEFA